MKKGLLVLTESLSVTGAKCNSLGQRPRKVQDSEELGALKARDTNGTKSIPRLQRFVRLR
ncbi:MAG: hypothetical protein QOJ64_1120 [Acidobacteriota bacterium]|nr:hypothetical protein [Acidobacteriota bacterium]